MPIVTCPRSCHVSEWRATCRPETQEGKLAWGQDAIAEQAGKEGEGEEAAETKKGDEDGEQNEDDGAPATPKARMLNTGVRE